jgi:VIT1/CCC1 family predicted Fe2+/Mn2+ transporter
MDMHILGKLTNSWVKLDRQMKDSVRTGITFGLTSAAITTLGLMVGLHSGTQSRIAVLGGILTIAIADAFSDALGIHVSEESENVHTNSQIWVATGATFFAKLLFALTFAVPVLILPLLTAVWASIVWGMSILVILSYSMAKSQGESPWKIIGEHILIALVVIAVSQWVGSWVSTLRG